MMAHYYNMNLEYDKYMENINDNDRKKLQYISKIANKILE